MKKDYLSFNRTILLLKSGARPEQRQERVIFLRERLGDSRQTKPARRRNSFLKGISPEKRQLHRFSVRNTGSRRRRERLQISTSRFSTRASSRMMAGSPPKPQTQTTYLLPTQEFSAKWNSATISRTVSTVPLMDFNWERRLTHFFSHDNSSFPQWPHLPM